MTVFFMKKMMANGRLEGLRLDSLLRITTKTIYKNNAINLNLQKWILYKNLYKKALTLNVSVWRWPVKKLFDGGVFFDERFLVRFFGDCKK